jgi:hypothetical protein
MNQPGSLTPIAYSPLPYETTQRMSSFPMVSMSETPKQTPSIDEINSLAQEISNIFSKQPTNNYGLPSVQLAPNYSSVQLPSVQLAPNYSSVQLPSVQLAPNYSSVQLPSVQLAPNYSSVQLAPNYSSVQLPSVNNYQFSSRPFFKSNLLSDNEIGDLRWNRPNPSIPLKITSSYRRVGCIGDGSCFFHAISKGLSDNYQLSYKKFDTITEITLRIFESSINNAMTFPSTLFASVKINDIIYPFTTTTSVRVNDPNAIYTFATYSNFSNLMSQYRRAYVKMLRADFADQVLNNFKMQSIIRKRLSGSIDLNIDTLLAQAAERGQILSLEQAQILAFQNVLRDLAQELLSGNAVQPDFMTLLSDQVDVDIYLIRDEHLTNSSLPDAITPLYGRALHDTVHGPSDLRDKNDIYAREPNRTSIVIIAVGDIHYEIIARVDESNEMERDIQTKMTAEEPLIKRLYEMLKTVRYIV